MSCGCLPSCSSTPIISAFARTVVRGDSLYWTMTFNDCNGDPMDTTGWEIWFILRESLETPFTQSFRVKLTVPSSEEAEAGQVVFTVNSASSAALVPGKYYYEFKRIITTTTPPDVWTFSYSTKPEFTVVEGSVVYS